MDLYVWRYVLIVLAAIIAVAIFFVEEKISKDSDKENIEFKENQAEVNKERLDFEEEQSKLNFILLKQISELQKQFDLSKSKDSSFDIGGEKWTYDQIRAYLKKQTDKSNSTLNRGIAYYELGNIKEAEKLFLEAIGSYPKNEEKKALIHSYLGELYLMLPGDLKKAKKNSLTAYKFYKSKQKEGVKDYLYQLGNITSNLGRILKKETDYNEAFSYYNESVDIRQKLAEGDPEKYLIDLGSIYNNIAVMFRENPKMGDAEELYLKALEIKRRAAKDNVNHLPSLAKTLNNLGNLCNLNQNNFQKSELYFKEAIDISQFIVDNGNKEYLIDLVNYQSGFAFAFENEFIKTKDKKYFKSSEDWFIQAIYNFNKIKNKQNFYFEYSNCLHNFGRLYKESGMNSKLLSENTKAEKYYKEALKLRKKLADSKLPINEVSLADTQLSLALLYTENIPNKDLALKYANKSYVNYNNNIDFRASKRWKQVSKGIIDFWNHI